MFSTSNGKNMLNCQIKELYENGDMDPIQIAEVLSLNEQDVKMVLISSSSKFRGKAKKNKSLFSEDDFAFAKNKMVGLIYSDHDNVAFRAAKFVINENSGRHDVQHLQTMNINVNLLNDQLLNMKKAIQNGKDKVIDIPSEVSHLAE